MELQLFNNALDYFDGVKEGYHEGIYDGVYETRKQIIFNMYKNDISLELISKCINLTIDEIKELLKK